MPMPLSVSWTMTLAAELVPWVPLLPAAVVLLALATTIVLVRRSRRARGEPPAASVPASETAGPDREPGR